MLDIQQNPAPSAPAPSQPPPKSKNGILGEEQTRFLLFFEVDVFIKPALMIVDRQGMLRFVHYAKNQSDIPSNAEVLAVLDELEGETRR